MAVVTEVKTRVVGTAGEKTQHLQSDGGRENTTVVVTICADGTSLRPVVIFKGKKFDLDWNQENPTEASLGHQGKGWIDSELAVHVLEDYDKQTAEKAAGRTRIYIVDGHISHHTLEFIRLARRCRIHVLCYPSHATHVYQGLDVVIFSILKRFWTEEKNAYIREKRQKIGKHNFLQIYGRAHQRALTPVNIRSAFRKTGVWPVDRNAISQSQLLPSLETSSRGTLPIPPSTPVRLVSEVMREVHRQAKRPRSPTPESEAGSSQPQAPQLALSTYLQTSMQTLRQTSSSFVVTSSSPVRASLSPPRLPTVLISPEKERVSRYADVLCQVPSTILEEELQNAVKELLRENKRQKTELIQMQSAQVLNGGYIRQVRGQLAAQQERKKNKQKGRLIGDGLPRLLTSTEYTQYCAETVAVNEEKAQQTESRKATKKTRGEVLAQWKNLEEGRKAENKRIRAEYQAEVAEWEREKEELKATGGRQTRMKPMLKGRLVPAIPRPAVLTRSMGSTKDSIEDPIEDPEADNNDIVPGHDAENEMGGSSSSGEDIDEDDPEDGADEMSSSNDADSDVEWN
ncbi:unnamed protein product [Mycena citricolor]|uniref:DDE-1 domain-containing protein n=1 Tax=Mycena citricolor TaxID=2018698 RepID=A0AAD2K2H3_9AGAR|nr:unnamed protein product [Mycena citricolor]